MSQVIFDDDECQLASRIPRTLHRAVRLAALEDGVSVKEWVCAALAGYLAAVEANPGTAAIEHTRKTRAGAPPRRARASA
jgi:hypothetical protein